MGGLSAAEGDVDPEVEGMVATGSVGVVGSAELLVQALKPSAPTSASDARREPAPEPPRRRVIATEPLVSRSPPAAEGIDFTDQMVAWYWFFSTMWISLPASPRLCEGALALWRGRPLDDLADLPAAMTLRSRAGAGALLEFDRLDDAVASVTAVLDDHPYDEELHPLLLRRLAASGRHGDAVKAYNRVRHRPAEEFGADPGRALRRLPANPPRS